MVQPLTGVNLSDVIAAIRAGGKPVRILWQHDDTIAFVGRARPGLAVYHIDPSDEAIQTLEGEIVVHTLTAERRRHTAAVPQGSIIHVPAGTPHWVQGVGEAFALVTERRRRPGEMDRWMVICDRCRTILVETNRFVPDYDADPVSGVYQEFISAPAKLTCPTCGRRATGA